MEKKTTLVNDLPISYFDSDNNNRPVIFIHGNSLSSQTFKFQLNDEKLRNEYRLIAPDLPGHGGSAKSSDPATHYSIVGFIEFITNFIKTLDLRDAVFVGHSLGGHILMHSWDQISDHAAGLVIFGAPPFTNPPRMELSHHPHPSTALAFKGELSETEINALAKAFVKEGESIPTVVSESIKQADSASRPTIGSSIIPENIKDEANLLQGMKTPITIYHGAEDQLINHSYYDHLKIPKLWRRNVQIVENAGHCPQLENPERFNQLLYSFLQEMMN